MNITSEQVFLALLPLITKDTLSNYTLTGHEVANTAMTLTKEIMDYLDKLSVANRPKLNQK
jgi:hypothetical protein